MAISISSPTHVIILEAVSSTFISTSPSAATANANFKASSSGTCFRLLSTAIGRCRELLHRQPDNPSSRGPELAHEAADQETDRMASAVDPQHHHSSDSHGRAIGQRKILPSSAVETPPSPPATDETDDTDSENPSRRRPATSRIDTNVAGVDGSEPGGRPSSSPVVSPVTSPPYWLQGHARSASMNSVDSIPTGAITLQDNESSGFDDRNNACWAKSVGITDYVVVNGSSTNIGAFVVWNIRVETLNGSFMNIRKRYSEFDDLRWRLIRTFPNFEAAVPELPPKSLISKFRPKFLEKRRAGLQYFLNCIMLNPEFSGSPVLKEFLFS
ncbi:hypothetical protein JX266_009252 [Neoarthrinium moseri]|uniref:uncharacterized protein n=1 Tax=Neoarthrinium moseri TaxID=1658444 RepID=UPI001FDBCCB8|nr:uncharacterized protein JN550_003959 [Neoarthrinium moseri]KAI1844579.1 hypothetical protein JX266_009252 [Neoarthrinium moseri]KAI1872240.1 hypothetical protein JN550_003959 [Neoarthrinium moseri]